MRTRTILLIAVTSLLLLGAAAAIGWFLIPSPPRVRDLLERFLAETLHADVRVHAARFDLPGRIVADGIRVAVPGRPHEIEAIRTDVEIETRWLRGLLGGRMFGRIRLVSPEIRIRQEADGSWNLESLLGETGSEGPSELPELPDVEVTGGRVFVSLLLPDGTRSLVGLGDVNLALARGRRGQGPTFRGTAVDPRVGRLDLTGALHPDLSLRRAAIAVHEVALTREPPVPLPEPVDSLWRDLGPTGVADLRFEADEAGGENGGVKLGLDFALRSLAVEPREFPYVLDEVRGSARLGSKGRLQLDLAVRAGETEVSVVGIVDDPFHEPRVDLLAAVKSYPLDERLRGVLDAVDPDIWPGIEPSGTIHVPRCRVVGPLAAPEVDLRAEFEDVGLTYAGVYIDETGRRVGFPYPLRNLSGFLEGRKGRYFLRLAGRQRSRSGDEPPLDFERPLHVAIEGAIHGRLESPVMELRILADDVPVNATLRGALAPHLQKIFDEFSPSGRCDISARFSRYDLPEHSSRVEADVWLREGSIQYAPFPYPLEDVEGPLRIRHRAVLLESIRGRRLGAQFTVDGFILGGGDEEVRDLQVTATNLPIDEYARTALRGTPYRLDEIWEDFAPTGVVDVSYRDTKAYHEPANRTARVAILDATSQPRWFAGTIERIAGEIEAKENLLHLRGLRGDSALTGSVTLDGWVDVAEDPPTGSLTLYAPRLELRPELEAAIREVPEEIHEAWERLAPDGTAAVELLLTFAPDRTVSPTVRFEPVGDCSFAVPYAPDRIRSAAGELALVDDGLRVGSLRGNLAGATLDLRGSLGSSRLGDRPPPIALSGKVTNLVLADHLFARLPDDVRERITSARLGGSVDLDPLRLESDPAHPESPWTFAGTVALHGVSALEDAVVAGLDATVVVSEGAFGPERLRFEATVKADRGEILGHPVSDLEAEIHGDRGSVRLAPLALTAYGGTVGGEGAEVEFVPGSPLGYRGALPFRNLRLKEYFEVHDPEESTIRGDVSGRIEFEGSGADILALRVQGPIDIEDARLFEVPIIRSILGVVPLRRPPVFTAARGRIRLADGVIEMKDLTLYSVPLSLHGEGTLDLDGTTELLLFPEFVPDLPSIFLVSDIWSLLQNELLAFRVFGPVDQPEARVENVVTGLMPRAEAARSRPLPPEFPVADRTIRF